MIFFLFLWCIFLAATIHADTKMYLMPVSELALLLLVLWFGENMAQKNGARLALRLAAALGIGIYLLECLYFSVVGEWVSVLAWQNISQLYLVLSYQRIFLLCVCALICFCYDRYVRGREALPKSQTQRRIWIGVCVISLIAVIVQNGWVLSEAQQRKLHPRSTPIAAFVSSAKKAFWTASYGDEIIGYPFEKDWIYNNNYDLTPKEGTTDVPNVILIFTEGTSARMIECYGGRYPGLTPNIDSFAKHCMRVDNYFNHTAPTFQGTLGQLTSCFTSGLWQYDKGLLATRTYQTLPRLLNENYDTTFLHPHKTDDPYTSLLQVCGFQEIYTRDTMPDLLGYQPIHHHESITDHDMYTALIHFCTQRERNQRPFFLAMYTFDTHVGISMPEGGQPYAGSASNEVLDTLHTCDAAFGKFWEFFQQSPLKDNTIVILTADHAHYYDTPYVSLVKDDEDYAKYFIDRIPLIIYDPIHRLPSEYDAHDLTSLSLTPTICQLLGINHVKNSFVGDSIFDGNNQKPMEIAAMGNDFYAIIDHRVKRDDDVTENPELWHDLKEKIKRFYACEEVNRIYH